jgi:hypothetical protein
MAQQHSACALATLMKSWPFTNCYRLHAKLEEKLDYIKKHPSQDCRNLAAVLLGLQRQKMDKPLCGYLIDAETDCLLNMPLSALLRWVSLSLLMPMVILNCRYSHPIPSASGTKDTRKNTESAGFVLARLPKIALDVVVQQLTTIEAQRYLASGIGKSPSGTVTVKPGKFGILPGLTEPDVLQTMHLLPGVVSIDETVSNLNVRGGTHDQNLFLWNGIRMFQTSHFFGLISAFNPMVTTKIRISKNGSSAFFGESVSSL